MKFLVQWWLGDKISAVDRDWVRINNSVRINQPTNHRKGKEGTIHDPTEEQLWDTFAHPLGEADIVILKSNTFINVFNINVFKVSALLPHELSFSYLWLANNLLKMKKLVLTASPLTFSFVS